MLYEILGFHGVELNELSWLARDADFNAFAGGILVRRNWPELITVSGRIYHS